MGLNFRVSSLERRVVIAKSAGSTGPLTGEDLAERIGVSGETVRRWASLGMPSCGRHPSRPAWPVYDEAACRAWAAGNQPQTALRPPTGAPAGPAPDDGLAAAKKELFINQCRKRALEVERMLAGLLPTDEVRACCERLAARVRARCMEMAPRTAPRLLAAVGRAGEDSSRVERIVADEIRLALEELDTNPVEAILAEHRRRHQ